MKAKPVTQNKHGITMLAVIRDLMLEALAIPLEAKKAAVEILNSEIDEAETFDSLLNLDEVQKLSNEIKSYKDGKRAHFSIAQWCIIYTAMCYYCRTFNNEFMIKMGETLKKRKDTSEEIKESMRTLPNRVLMMQISIRAYEDRFKNNLIFRNHSKSVKEAGWFKYIDPIPEQYARILSKIPKNK